MDVENMVQNEYNNMLLTPAFWKLLKGDKVLIYQEDSFIFHGNKIDEYMDYNFIGAPMTPINTTPTNKIMYNGGFSLRTREMMIQMLENRDISVKKISISREVKQYMQITGLTQCPEDVYFSTYACSNSPKANRTCFASERIFNKDAVGMHCMWMDSKCDWIQYLYEYFLKISVSIMQTKNHNNNNCIMTPVYNELPSMFIEDEDVVRTRLYCTPEYYKKDIIDIDNPYVKKFVLIIDFANGGGGTTMFLNYIISKYKLYQTFVIVRSFAQFINFNLNDEYDIVNYYENKDNKFKELITNWVDNNRISQIFVNHTWGFSAECIDFILNIQNIKKITITHDYRLIHKKVQPWLNEMDMNMHMTKDMDMNKYDMIITQHPANLNNFESNTNNIVVHTLPEYRYKYNKIEYESDNKTVIGIIGSLIDIKGLQVLKLLMQYCKSNNNNKYRFIIFGYVNENIDCEHYLYNNIKELNELLIKYQPNVLLELSLWAETYSYTLSLAMITDLPIICLQKTNNYSTVVESRLIEYAKVEYINEYNIYEFCNIVDRVRQDYLYTVEERVYFTQFWDDLFITNKYPVNNNNNNNNIELKKYAIYFPQFYEFMENDLMFYKGYTDYDNLWIAKEEYDCLLPANKTYDLLDGEYLAEQLSTALQYDISGFATYYYWFSTNSIGNNQIMDKVTNKMFSVYENKREKNVMFFIWANEDWTNNENFKANPDDKKILLTNEYTKENMELNADNLISYFSQDVYVKVDEKPVFMLYHTWALSIEELNMFYEILNEKCILSGFKGVQFYVNVMNGCPPGLSPNIKQFHMNFNYKNNVHGSRYLKRVRGNEEQAVLDYGKYLSTTLHIHNNNNNNNTNPEVQTLCFDFDNTARLIKPNRLQNSTICIKNTEYNKILFMHELQKKYANDNGNNNRENILLVNAWNEWGEKMAIEPSLEIGYYYLNLLNQYL